MYVVLTSPHGSLFTVAATATTRAEADQIARDAVYGMNCAAAVAVRYDAVEGRATCPRCDGDGGVLPCGDTEDSCTRCPSCDGQGFIAA